MRHIANTRRHFLSILGGGAVGYCLPGCRRRPDADATELRLGHNSVPGKPLFDAAAQFADMVNHSARSGVRVEVFAQGALGDSRLAMESTAIGTLDMSCEAPLSPVVPEMALLELPYLFADAEHAAENLDGAFGRLLSERAEARGVVVLGYFTDAPRSIFNRSRDVRSPENLTGLKIRVPEGRVWIEMMNRFGAMAIPLSWGEVYSAIEQHVIAGAEADLISIERACLQETCKHVSETNHVLLVYPLIINRTRFESLSSDDRHRLKQACRNVARSQRAKLPSRLDESRRRLIEQDVSIIKVDQAPFRERVLVMHEDYARRLGAEDIMALMTPPGRHAREGEAGT